MIFSHKPLFLSVPGLLFPLLGLSVLTLPYLALLWVSSLQNQHWFFPRIKQQTDLFPKVDLANSSHKP